MLVDICRFLFVKYHSNTTKLMFVCFLLLLLLCVLLVVGGGGVYLLFGRCFAGEGVQQLQQQFIVHCASTSTI